MSGDIFVIVLGVLALGAGAWGLWYERHSSDDDSTGDGSAKE